MNNIVTKEIVDSYNEYLNKIQGSGKMISDLFKEGNEEEALLLITQIAEGLEWLSKVSAHLVEYDLKVKFDIEKLNDVLNELNEGLSINDYILVSDILEYELDPFLAECKAVEILS